MGRHMSYAICEQQKCRSAWFTILYSLFFYICITVKFPKNSNTRKITVIFFYAFQWIIEISRWNRNRLFLCFKKWNYNFWIFTVLVFFVLLYFMNSLLKVLPKRFKCSILVWNYGDDVNILWSNRWHLLLCWRNIFSAGMLLLTAAFFSAPISWVLLL